MKALLLLFAFCLSLNAAPQPTSPWIVYSFAGSGPKGYKPSNATGVGGDLATFSFPKTGNNVAYPAFLTTTTVTNHLGNLTGQTISATLSLTTTGSPGFRYGGQGTWNLGTLPANTRLFISTSAAAYSNPGYTACPSCYWWSGTAWTQISATTGKVTLTGVFNPTNWSNAKGKSGSSLLSEFTNAVANVRQIGFSYGGGSFYDVGIAVTNGTGTATFHLLSFDVQ